MNISVLEIKTEILCRDMAKMEERPSKMEKEVNPIRKNSNEQRMHMVEAHRHVDQSKPKIITGNQAKIFWCRFHFL